MHIRSAGYTALQLLFLMSSLLDAAGCELLCLDGPDASSKTLQAVGAEAEICPVETEHDDDCPCCGLYVPRVSFEPSTTTDPAIFMVEAAPAQRGVFFVDALAATHLSRGPPVS